jgi:hypothetical protein
MQHVFGGIPFEGRPLPVYLMEKEEKIVEKNEKK